MVRVVRESNDTDVLVYTVNTADGNDALEPVDVKDGSSDSTTKDKEPWASYITWVERDASTVPFRIVSKRDINAGLHSLAKGGIAVAVQGQLAQDLANGIAVGLHIGLPGILGFLHHLGGAGRFHCALPYRVQGSK